MKQVYLLLDPVTFSPRYIGCSKDPIERQKRRYLQNESPKVLSWLISLDQPPIVKIVYTGENDEACRVEHVYRDRLRKRGEDLLNTGLGYPQHVRDRMSASQKARRVKEAKERLV